jgi:hypothetical protein
MVQAFYCYISIRKNKIHCVNPCIVSPAAGPPTWLTPRWDKREFIDADESVPRVLGLCMV